jgi:hypothetical protein
VDDYPGYCFVNWSSSLAPSKIEKYTNPEVVDKILFPGISLIYSLFIPIIPDRAILGLFDVNINVLTIDGQAFFTTLNRDFHPFGCISW